MLVGGDFTEFIEPGGVNGAKFDAVGISVRIGCSSDLRCIGVTDVGIIDGKPFETVDCVIVGGHEEVCCTGCCCSIGADGCSLLVYS
jgi:hypothetical protein